MAAEINPAKRRTAATQHNYAHGELTLEQYRAQRERERLERRARQVMRDIAYKAALGLDPGQPLPKQIGAIGAPSRVYSAAIRGTKRLSA